MPPPWRFSERFTVSGVAGVAGDGSVAFWDAPEYTFPVLVATKPLGTAIVTFPLLEDVRERTQTVTGP